MRRESTPKSQLLEIVRAAPGDAPVLSEVSTAAKAYWSYPAEWMKEWQKTLTITAEFVMENFVYLAKVDGEVLGFYSLNLSGSRATLEHLWIRPARIRHGIGSTLFKHAVQLAIDLKAEAIEIESDPHAAGFYERMGAKRIGEHVSSICGVKRLLPVLALNLRESEPQPKKRHSRVADKESLGAGGASADAIG